VLWALRDEFSLAVDYNIAIIIDSDVLGMAMSAM
jgi:hypothetical protein